jgi:hypothetical protein
MYAFTVTRGTACTSRYISLSVRERIVESAPIYSLGEGQHDMQEVAMNAPLRTERLFLMDPTDSRVPQSVTASDHIAAELANPDLIAVLIACGIGLLTTVALLIAFPSFGEMAASFQQFP